MGRMRCKQVTDHHNISQIFYASETTIAGIRGTCLSPLNAPRQRYIYFASKILYKNIRPHDCGTIFKISNRIITRHGANEMLISMPLC